MRIQPVKVAQRVVLGYFRWVPPVGYFLPPRRLLQAVTTTQ
jgi:hypothetical protein